MRAGSTIVAMLLPLAIGCASTEPFWTPEAYLCNTPGRKELAQQIVARGGSLMRERSDWDRSVDEATKEKMGPPLSEVIMPSDKFSNAELAEAKQIFPEARVIAPPTMADFDENPELFLGPGAASRLEELAENGAIDRVED